MTAVEQLFGPLIALLRAEFGDGLLGVLATGSRIHGTPSPTSDLDVHVVIDQPRRQRRNIVLDGIEIELFINPPFQIRRYMADGRGNDTHMFAFGRAIYDPYGVIAQLQDEAGALWQAGPPPIAAGSLWMPRYFAADMLRDLSDLGEDEAAASLQLARIVDQLIETHCRLAQRWAEKPKRRLTDLERWAPELARLAREALICGPLAERRAAVERMAELVLAPIGGPMPLEWRNEWERLAQPTPADEGLETRDEGPNMKNVVGIAEIVLWTADQRRALEFYRDLLGLEVISPPNLANVFLKVGEGNAGIPQMIVLVPKPEEIRARPSGYQLHHMALELPDDQFDAMRDALIAAGHAPRGGKHPVLASRTMYVDDPDGNEVEFICRAPAT